MANCETIKSFTYNGYSSKNILSSSSLMLVSYSKIDELDGTKRETVKGDTTMYKQSPNYYGTISELATFEYCLMKSNLELFTFEEQLKIERWLTSPKLPKQLILYNENNIEICIYCGLFTETSWIPYGDGFSGIKFTFENNAPYPIKKYSSEFTVEEHEDIVINCDSDELEEYIYPVITITPEETGNVEIYNSEDDKTMDIKVYNRLPVILDCRNCIPSDPTENGVFSYDDLGWEDVGDIYWMRLKAGSNNIEINGNAKIKFEYSCPYKIVGAWL